MTRPRLGRPWYRVELRNHKGVHNLSASGFQFGQRLFKMSNNSWIGNRRLENLAKHAEARTLQSVDLQPTAISWRAMTFGARGRRVLGVRTDDRAKQNRHIRDAACHRASRVPDRVKGHHTGPRHKTNRGAKPN